MVILASAPQLFADRRDVVEEGLDESKEFLPRRRELEWPALKQRQPQIFLELDHLTAHRRLLNAVRHVAHGFADAPVPGHVVEQFKVMGVHGPV